MPVQPTAVQLAGTKAAGFTLHIAERRLLLRSADLACLAIALYAALALAHPERPAFTQAEKWPQWLGLLGAIWMTSASVSSCYDLRIAGRLRTSLSSLARALAVTTVLYLLIPYLSPPLLSSRLALMTWVAVAAALTSLVRISYVALLARPAFQRRAIVAGDGEAARGVLAFLRAEAPIGYAVAGLVTPHGQPLEGIAALGSYAELSKVARERGIDEIILVDEDNAQLAQAALELYQDEIRLRRITELYEELTGRISVTHIRGRWLDVLPMSPGGGRVYDVVSHLLDLILAASALILLAPVLLAVALAIFLDDGGPVLYRQLRLGKLGRQFEILKFRTMIRGAEGEEGVWAEPGDHRRTRVGGLLRRIHADELPQLWNVVRGDMALIGPRPERPAFVERLEQDVPLFRARLLVRPGITGWAQVQARYASSLADSTEKLEYDLYYVKRRSPYLDLVIALKTIGVVLRAGGR